MLSRVAESLYWMSRYLERAEHTSRLLDVHQQLSLELPPQNAEQRFNRVLDALQVDGPRDDVSLENLTFAPDRPESVLNSVGAARENARQIREQISSEMFEQLNRLYLLVRQAGTRESYKVEPHKFYQEVKEGAHLFQGITDSTMTHGQGWYFIQAGRFLERAGSIATLIDVMLLPLMENADPHYLYLELLGVLRSCTAWEAYCKVYTAELAPESMLEFLLLNRDFPHSLYHSVDQLVGALRSLAEATGATTRPVLEPLVGRLQSNLRYTPLCELLPEGGARAFLSQARQTLNQTHGLLYRLYLSEHYERSGL